MKKIFKPTFLLNSDPEDVGGKKGPQDKKAEDAFIENIRTQVAEQVRSMAKDDNFKKDLSGVFENYLGGMTPEQIRSLSENNENLTQDLAVLATKLEKINQRSYNGPTAKASMNAVEFMLNKRFSDIENILNAKNQNTFIDLNMRAAQIITTETAVDWDGLTVDDLKDSISIDSFTEKRRSREYIFEIADRVTVQSIEKTKTWFTEGNEEGAFAIVAESGLKPMVSIDLIPQVSKVQKVAGHTVYTDEVAKFKREAYLIIRRLINDKLLRDFQNILTTALVANAAPYVSSALDGQYTNPTDYHAIAAVAAQIEALDFFPDTLIINPQDKWRIGMSQDNTGAFYLAIPAASPDGQPTLLGFRVVTSTKIPVGKFILGEAGLWKIEDEGVTVKIGYGVTQVKNEQGVVTDVQDDLTHNRFRVISELYFHSYIDQSNEGSFVYGDFEVIKDLLTAPAAPEA